MPGERSRLCYMLRAKLNGPDEVCLTAGTLDGRSSILALPIFCRSAG